MNRRYLPESLRTSFSNLVKYYKDPKKVDEVTADFVGILQTIRDGGPVNDSTVRNTFTRMLEGYKDTINELDIPDSVSLISEIDQTLRHLKT